MIYDYRDVRDTAEGAAGGLYLLVILVKKIDARFISRVGPGAALYRYAQNLLARRSTRDEIDSRVVYVSALKAPL
ncbi:MAG: hypothetical protein IPO43_21190 [Rhodoferax sp.]|nr:hypothetical protein [Rhodoferax sp.]